MPSRPLRRSLSALALAAGAYTLVVAGLYWRQRDVLYQPPRKPQGPDEPVDVLLAGQGQPALRGWVDNPGQPCALVYFGGSSEAVEVRREAMKAAFPGHTRYLVPYRGFGPNRGLASAMDEHAIKADAVRVFDRVRQDHEHVDVLGRSLGTGVALHVAARRKARRVGLITPYDSILEIAKARYRWLPVRIILKDRFESWRDALGVSAPILALLAESDCVTPHRCWERLRTHFLAPLEVATIPDSNHTNIVDLPHSWSSLAAFFSGQATATGPAAS